jgi:hypothetical protein
MATETSAQETWRFDPARPSAMPHTVRAPRFYLAVMSVVPT